MSDSEIITRSLAWLAIVVMHMRERTVPRPLNVAGQHAEVHQLPDTLEPVPQAGKALWD